MTADELLRHLTSALFIVVFAGAAVTAARQRTRPALDAAVFFGVLALVIVQGEILRILGLQPHPLVADILVVLVVALPYVFIRLVDDLVGVRRLVLTGSVIGLILLSAAVLLTPAPLPGPLTVAAVVYFAGLLIYGSAILVGEARHAAGVARRRTQAAALGSVLLGAAVLAAGVRLVMPVPEETTRLVTLGAALAYAAAFAPPGFLRRTWREPGLRAFLARVAAVPPTSPIENVLAELEAAAADVAGAVAVDIVVREPSGDGTARLRSGDTVPPATLLGRAMSERATIMSTDLARDDAPAFTRHAAVGARSGTAAPMIMRGRVVGALGAYFRRIPLFPDEEQGIADILARQSGAVLDHASAYARLTETNERLESATRAKTEFLANMSHELRTPMNAILGFSDILLEQLGERLTPSQLRYFRNIKDAGGHLLEIINEVLDLSKVEAGKVEIRAETISLASLVEPVASSTRTAAGSRQVEFDLDLPADREVRVDPSRVRQILYNLLSNAVKFTDPGGHVRLRAATAGRDLLLEVSDTGIGIPPEAHGRVFGTFERLHEGRSDAGGTGLGLALTKRLVELHEGTISFESRPGEGTTFSVRLPNTLAEPMTGPRVLIVDDDRRDAELVAALATATGLPSEIVRTASEARAAVRRDPPTAVVLDLRLPDERGERVLEEIKASAATSHIPVIVVTVEDDEGNSRPLGADDHITKPVDPDRLASWLRRRVGPRRSGGSPAGLAPE